MGIVWTRLGKGGRRASVSEAGVRRYTLVYLVRTDDVTVGALEILLTADLPRFHSSYATETESDRAATLREYNPRQTDDPRLWEVECEYSSEFSPRRDADNVERDAGDISPAGGATPSPSGGIGSADQRDPLLRRPEVSWTFAAYQKPTMFALNPNFDPSKPADDDAADPTNPQFTPIVSSGDEPYDPPVEIDDSRPVYRCSRNERFFSPAVGFDYMNAINLDNFKGAAPGQAKMQNISADLQWESNFAYYRVSYEVHFRTDTQFGWTLRLLDMGTQKKVAGGWQALVQKNGVPVQNPVPLDGNGNRLSAADVAAGRFKWRTFDVYKTRKFGPLKLP